jgi:Domain of unknown function (DUF4907)
MPSLTRMTKRKRLFVFALLSVLILAAVAYTSRGHFYYNVDVYKSGQGWGYDILVKNKTYIHQPFMPAVEGQVPFSDRQSARKTGRLVVRKLKNHKIPSVTKEELKSMIKD